MITSMDRAWIEGPIIVPEYNMNIIKKNIINLEAMHNNGLHSWNIKGHKTLNDYRNYRCV